MATATIPSEIRIFATIAEQGSFVSAARRLRIPKTTISRKIAELEARLGVGLFERTTRKLALTEAGQVFYGHCAGILVSIENAETAIGQLTQTPRGTVRLTAPFSFAAFSLAPVLPEFIARFPEVRIDLQVRSDMVDLILDNIDVALRWGSLGDSSHISRSLCAVSSVLVASPGYLALAGTPASVAGLTRHRTLGMTQHTQTGETQGWDLVRAPASDGGRAGAKSTHGAAIPGESVNLRPVLTANAAEPLLQATVAGLGIACLPLRLVATALASGTLTRVLPEWLTAPVPLQVVYPSRRGLQPKARVLVEFLVEKFTGLKAGDTPSLSVRPGG